jgi:hypothetical protein
MNTTKYLRTHQKFHCDRPTDQNEMLWLEYEVILMTLAGRCYHRTKPHAMCDILFARAPGYVKRRYIDL